MNPFLKSTFRLLSSVSVPRRLCTWVRFRTRSSGKNETDIPVAKQMIDILGMLREKTRGNLDAGEEQLVEDVLFDLRMKYVEAVKKK